MKLSQEKSKTMPLHLLGAKRGVLWDLCKLGIKCMRKIQKLSKTPREKKKRKEKKNENHSFDFCSTWDIYM